MTNKSNKNTAHKGKITKEDVDRLKKVLEEDIRTYSSLKLTNEQKADINQMFEYEGIKQRIETLKKYADNSGACNSDLVERPEVCRVASILQNALVGMLGAVNGVEVAQIGNR